VQYGPDSTRVRSITVTPDNAPDIPAFYGYSQAPGLQGSGPASRHWTSEDRGFPR